MHIIDSIKSLFRRIEAIEVQVFGKVTEEAPTLDVPLSPSKPIVPDSQEDLPIEPPKDAA